MKKSLENQKIARKITNLNKMQCPKCIVKIVTAIRQHVCYTGGLFEGFNTLQTPLYSIVALLVTFSVSTKIWPLSQVTLHFTTKYVTVTRSY